MKTVIINASPRKRMNTAQLLERARQGAESVGAEVTYVNLYDLDFRGCRSCLACKRKGAQGCKCFWPDELSPLIDRIFHADAVIIGTPIYVLEPTAEFRALFERLVFCAFSYDDHASRFDGHINLGLVYTMNLPEAGYRKNVRPSLARVEDVLHNVLNGRMSVHAACDTLQVRDYSRYDMAAFDEDHKRRHREEQFPRDLEACYRMGAELSSANAGA